MKKSIDGYENTGPLHFAPMWHKKLIERRVFMENVAAAPVKAGTGMTKGLSAVIYYFFDGIGNNRHIQSRVFLAIPFHSGFQLRKNANQ